MELDDVPPLVAEDNAMSLCDSDNANYSDDSADDEAWSNNGEPTTCLFCVKISSSVEDAILHLKSEHDINFALLKQKFQMDQYSFLKLINYIRLENIPSNKIVHAQEVFWADEKYLKPKEYEPWLSYDYDEMIEEDTIKTTAAQDLQLQLQSLQNKVKEQARLLEQALEDMNKMRIGFQRLVEKESNVSKNELNYVSAASVHADEGYFSSYAHFGIHHEMLSDVVRTSSYRNALLNNKDFVSGKDVLDVGCGTSVLSIFASQAGAKTVLGIDNSDIIYNAMDIIKKNNINNVTLVKGRLEDTTLPQEKFDIIISEWMGYFLLFEGMLDSVIYARDHHLKDGGTILPNRCTMSIVGYGNQELYNSHVTFWDNIYGLNMSTMRNEVMHEPLIDIVDAAHILTESNIIADLNLSTVDLNYSNFSFDFNLKCVKSGKLSSIVGYFDTYFDLPNPVMFGTSPKDKPTHWKQVVFFIDEPVEISLNDLVNGKLICKRSRSSARSLDIIIEIFGKKYKYYLD